MDRRTFYERANIEHVSAGDAAVTYRSFGKGKSIVFIHGFQTN